MTEGSSSDPRPADGGASDRRVSPDPEAVWRRDLSAPTPLAPRDWKPPALAAIPALTVLAHPDPARVGERAVLRELAAGEEIALSRLAPCFASPLGGEPRPLADPFVSRRPVVLRAGADNVLDLDRSGSATVVEIDGETVTGVRRLTAAALDRGVVLVLARRLALLLHRVSPLPLAELPEGELIGASDAMLRVREAIHRVAPLDVPVLLRGATGTGKELAARALHRASPRREAPCLAVNMAAVPPSLAAAELFGAAAGAYTGATRKQPGYFRRAHGGTLFLDEIGEMPPEVQSALLRVLESGEIQPVGGARPERVDVRVVAATDSNLEAQIEAGRFRAPLVHRLAGYEIELPPLRERRDDIGRLLVHFLRSELARCGAADRLETPADPVRRPWLPASLVARLATLDWPGNVRQLKNVARRLAIACHDAAEAWIEPERLSEEAERPGAGSATEGPSIGESSSDPDAGETSPSRPSYRPITEVGDAEMLAALRVHRYQVKTAADALGVSRTALYSRIERHPHLRKAGDLSAAEIERRRGEVGDDLIALAEALEVSPDGLRLRLKQLEADLEG